jgi:CheY-like chemotaxis protein
MQPELLDLNALLVSLGEMLRRGVSRDIELIVVPGAVPGTVKADQGQIEQVIMNLAVHACDRMPHGGTLTLETANVALGEAHARPVGMQPGPYVTLTVGDTGAGEAGQAALARLDDHRDEGPGVGLAAVYRIVEQIGASLQVNRQPGQGTTCSIYLPQAEAAVASAGQGRMIPPPVRRELETILLVEDDDMVRGLARHVLQQNGYLVLEARHGAEALRLCERHPGPVHLVVSDVALPHMGGPELVERLMASRPQMRVIYMSGYTQPDLVQGGAQFLRKPFTPGELVRMVHETLAGVDIR